jgi:flavin-dependent dehydrogenase
MLERTDVIVIGGGPAGTLTALTLARLGVQVAVVERHANPVWKIGETLAPESTPFLHRVGISSATLRDEGHLPSPGNCSAWGSNHLACKDFISNPHGDGWQLDRVRFETMLQNLAEAAGATMLRACQAHEFVRDRNHWELNLGDQQLRARWLVDASGRRAVVARRLGISRSALDQLVSVYTTHSSENETDLDARTYIEACQKGWWYTARMPGGRRTVAFQTDADLLPGQEWRSPSWFLEQIRKTNHIGALLERHAYSIDGPPQLTSAHSGKLNAYHGDGWIAVGDAAHCFDPLAGQGLFTAILSGHYGAMAIAKAWRSSRNAFFEYAAALDGVWRQFVLRRGEVYSLERRWLESPFWKRRSFCPV